MTTEVQEDRDLAQRAFDIYDAEGEEARLSFILMNEEQAQNPDDLDPGQYTLTDKTAIEHLGERGEDIYMARWGSNNNETRPATIKIENQPTYINLQVPLLTYPNAGSVVTEILDRVESAARGMLGLIYDERFLTTYDAIKSMPGLPNAIRKAIAAQQSKPFPSHRMHDYLDAIIQDCASDVIAFLPESEYQGLIDKAVQKLEQKGHTDEAKQETGHRT